MTAASLIHCTEPEIFGDFEYPPCDNYTFSPNFSSGRAASLKQKPSLLDVAVSPSHRATKTNVVPQLPKFTHGIVPAISQNRVNYGGWSIVIDARTLTVVIRCRSAASRRQPMPASAPARLARVMSRVILTNIAIPLNVHAWKNRCLCYSCGVPETVRHYVMECICHQKRESLLPASQTGIHTGKCLDKGEILRIIYQQLNIRCL